MVEEMRVRTPKSKAPLGPPSEPPVLSLLTAPLSRPDSSMCLESGSARQRGDWTMNALRSTTRSIVVHAAHAHLVAILRVESWSHCALML